jgi:hypothetical protein
MQRLGQPLDHVAGLMELAPLCRRVAVDDEQPTDRRVEPALDQIVDQRLDHSGIFGRPLDQAERMLIAVVIDAEGGDQHQVVANMQAIDLDDQQVEFG